MSAADGILAIINRLQTTLQFCKTYLTFNPSLTEYRGNVFKNTGIVDFLNDPILISDELGAILYSHSR